MLYSLKAFIFDLDGTLLNTLQDIADAENSVLKEMGLSPRQVNEYRWIVGGGADNIARKLLPEDKQTEQEIKAFVQRFRFYYHRNWNTKTQIYPGISELIKQLLEREYGLAVLSNKPEEFVQKIVSHYFPAWEKGIFTNVIGHSAYKPAKPDPGMALHLAQNWQINPVSIGFIGDSDIDILTAKNAGMVSIGAVWGFRGREELEVAGADILLNQPLELIEYLEEEKH